MTARRRTAPVRAPRVSSSPVRTTSGDARRPLLSRSSHGSTYQLTWREKNNQTRVDATAARRRRNQPGRLLGSTVRGPRVMSLSFVHGESRDSLHEDGREHAVELLGCAHDPDRSNAIAWRVDLERQYGVDLIAVVDDH